MASAATTEENKQIARRFIEEVVNGGDFDRIDEFVDEAVVDHAPFGETRGRDALVETIEYVRSAFEEFTVTPEAVVAEGDVVAVRMTQRGVHRGEFMGAEATGRRFEIGAMAFARMAEGKIAERWVQPDVLGLLTQLGVVEPPGA